MVLSERDLNIALRKQTQSPPAHKSPPPQSQPHSKLPRRVATPFSAASPSTSTPQWPSSVAERIARAERAAGESNSPLELKQVTITRRSAPKKLNTSTANKPLPHEKTLPPRPIALLSSLPSPSKDSRSLIDAGDLPLHIMTPSGEKQEWPSLTPAFKRSPSIAPDIDPREPGAGAPPIASSLHPTPISLPAVAAELRGLITLQPSMGELTTKRRSHSDISSYTTAAERLPGIVGATGATGGTGGTGASGAAESNNARRSSWMPRRSNPAVGFGQQEPEEFRISRSHSHVNAIASQNMPARRPSLKERISSGSLVSPPPGVKNQVMGFTDFTRVQTDFPNSSASRHASPSPANFSRPRREGASSMTAADRSIKTVSRIPIPDFKKAAIVDVGLKDRTSDSSTAQSGDAPVFGSRRLASPEALKILENGKIRRQLQTNTGTESPDPAPLQRTVTIDSETSTIDTPSLSYSFDSSPDITSGSHKSSAIGPNAQVSALNARLSRLHPAVRSEEQLRIEQLQALGAPMRAPPSTSPFTAPLQTIKSEAVLPVDNECLKESDDEVLRALSHLEGKGSPPKLHVDQQTVEYMFAHLHRGQLKAAEALNDNAAAAERFLAQESQRTIDEDAVVRKSAHHIVRQKAAPAYQHSDTTTSPAEATPISKWSDSTPSDNPHPRPSEDVFGGRNMGTTKEMPSIGFPSTMPARPVIPTRSGDDDAATATGPSRRSSTTLGGRRKQGSVKNARAGLQPVTPSFARPTTATQYKRAAKMPTLGSNVTSSVYTVERGRTASRKDPHSETGRSKRSQSKSRLVLDKINGLFSGKRERKSEVPPLPRMDPNIIRARGISSPISLNSPTTPVVPVQVPSASPSPSPQVALRTTSQSTTIAHDVTLVDRISLKDESQSIKALAEHLINKAKHENNNQRKGRLLTFAKILTDSLISVREAAISAQAAVTAAKDARTHYEMTLKALTMVQRLATSVTRSPGSNNGH